MGLTTNIEWAEATINFWFGCTKVSPACDNCYAETWAERFKVTEWGPGKPRVWSKTAVKNAFALDRRAAQEGRRITVFANSLSDFFDDEVPEGWRDNAVMTIRLTPNLDWLILTKRPKVARAYITSPRFTEIEEAVVDMFRRLYPGRFLPPVFDLPFPLPNLWLGTTVENQKMANLRIPDLLDTPSVRRFVSYEPALGPVDFTRIVTRWGSIINALTGRMVAANHSGDVQRARLDQIIFGGESSSNARPPHPDWARSTRDQCVPAGVAFFLKQWGEWMPGSGGKKNPVVVLRDGRWCEDTKAAIEALDRDRAVPPQNPSLMHRAGKKKAGRELDGRIWDQMPKGDLP